MQVVLPVQSAIQEPSYLERQKSEKNGDSTANAIYRNLEINRWLVVAMAVGSVAFLLISTLSSSDPAIGAFAIIVCAIPVVAISIVYCARQFFPIMIELVLLPITVPLLCLERIIDRFSSSKEAIASHQVISV